MDKSPTAPDIPPSSSGLKVLGKSNRSRTTPADFESMESSSRSNGRSSIESTLDRPKSSQAGDAPETVKAGPSGFSKLIDGARRRRNKKKDKKQADEASVAFSSDNDRELHGSRSNDSRDETSVSSSLFNDNPGLAENEVGNLLTDDSEPERTPPLTSHNSHTGFYTTSSPLIKTVSVDANDTNGAHGDAESAVSGPTSEPSSDLSRSVTQPNSELEIPAERNGKKRGVSPGRRLKDAFNPGQDKNRPADSPDRSDRSSLKSEKSKSGLSMFGNSSRRSSLSARRAQTVTEPPPPPPLPNPIRTDITTPKPHDPAASPTPQTPPHTAIPAPMTTVSPPTPNGLRAQSPQLFTSEVTGSPESLRSQDGIPGIVVSPSGNMISHRRVRSASAAHKPSKLSNSISALSPTIIEEVKNPGSRSPSNAQQSGFFSSVFSAAQNAASTISSSLNTQSKPRTGPSASAVTENTPPDNETDEGSPPAEDSNGEEKKPMAIDTLGTGDLNFSHLDIDLPSGGMVQTTDGVVITKPDNSADRRKSPAVYQRDEEAARLEDRRAARAVSMAYERPPELSTILPEDGIELQTSSSISKDWTGDQTPPSGSIIDGETSGGLKRSGSVRSRLAQRRHRGSSGATASTIGAIGASAIALGVPGANSSVPRLTGFAVASKKRNRDFHHLFRSVPEDDYLIEDYSCALQREIILAGRIYISEGHICFSSNILGWVTTLVISFDEIVAIEKENTAMVFPNAIAIQTLHARHTFRSLLSRESTYDLMVNIWKINHPSLKSSVNGTRIANGTGDKTEKADESDADSDVSDEDEVYDEDEEGNNADSFYEAGEASIHGSELSLSTKGLNRKPSGLLQGANGTTPAVAGNTNGDSKGDKSTSAAEGNADFPGPPTHPPTEYNDPASRYDKLIKDDIIPAPLGKIYSLVFGPASGVFMTKFLVDNQKSMELQFEDKKGLSNENKTRQYSYIKPLNGSIGPKQTKCISTENLDFLDLEKAVLVTLGTQTPDVPSGNVFCTKTKYLFTWAPGNQTRFLMTCTIEWSGKSWLKGPIEKGAIDGQTAFGNELVKTLKAAVAPRGRANGASRPGGKGKHRRKKGDMADQEASAESSAAENDAAKAQAESWGLFEPLRGPLSPIASILKPLWTGNVAVLVVGALLFTVFFRTPSHSPMLSHDVGCPGWGLPQRLAAYEEMWRREESELWHWLEERVGMDGMSFPTVHRAMESQTRQKKLQLNLHDERGLQEKMSDREMDHAIRTTRERLDILEAMLNKRKLQHGSDESTVPL